MNLPQRLALLVALGVLLHVSATAIVFEEPRTFIGEEPRFGSPGQAIVVALHIAAWTAAALWLLRDRPDD